MNQSHVPLVIADSLTLDQVARIMCCGQKTWLRWVSAGKAPQPILLGERLVAWRVVDLENWLDQKQRAGVAS